MLADGADLALPREHSDRAFRHSVQPRSRFAGASPDRQTVKDGLRESTNCVDVRRLRHVSLPLRSREPSRQNPVELADDLAQIALQVGVRRGLDWRRTEHEATGGLSRSTVDLERGIIKSHQRLFQVGLVRERSTRPRFHPFHETSECQPIDALLVAEGVRDARPIHSHRFAQLIEGGPCEPVRPEHAHCGVECRVSVELARAPAWPLRWFYTVLHKIY